jgi:phosphoserine phosphatase RsbU/P
MSEDKSNRSTRLKMSNFKLNALLEITLAINENLPVEELIKRYENILKVELEIGKVIIFKHNEKWECILNSGFSKEVENPALLTETFLNLREITPVTSYEESIPQEIDLIIPVIHKEQPIAYVLIGDIEEEKDTISPIIKHLRYIQTLSNILIVAIENIRLYNESLKQVAMKKEMELASRMQTMLIPEKSNLPSNNYLCFRAFYHPHYDVGGDYYDVVRLSDTEVGFCIADVSGKGISAAILMSNFQANLRALFTRDIKIEDLICRLNERVLDSAKGEKFITLFLAKYNYQTRILEFINAGHNPPFLYHTVTGEMQHLKSGCVGMGMLDDLPFINKQSMVMKDHIKLLSYTDGLVELIEGEDVGYGYTFIEGRISNALPLEENIMQIIRDQKIMEGNTSIFDDISILGVEFFGHEMPAATT